jgi:hypothetical protein
MEPARQDSWRRREKMHFEPLGMMIALGAVTVVFLISSSFLKARKNQRLRQVILKRRE